MSEEKGDSNMEWPGLAGLAGLSSADLSPLVSAAAATGTAEVPPDAPRTRVRTPFSALASRSLDVVVPA